MSSTLRRLLPAVAIVSFAICAAPLYAQGADREPSRRWAALLDEIISRSATLELLMLGVTAISDAQRDSVEVLEQQLRDSVALHATRIVRARQTATGWWSAEHVMHEREINAILATRARAIERMRDTLTQAQRTRFDRNVLVFRDWHVTHWRDPLY